ncbi:WGR domain-containing protein [Leptospira interrogans]|uniref:WGR domain-containing protein n=3 Tax=Leptospira interrogans TaxID=173 RepID=UPI0002927E38|nr:WGR domain-containing protein [Leptospira interrogans]EKO70186.1 ATP-dependent DNA ligase-like domain protein [Leptospira interrogans serovar Canicola str. Fiocruz LV133]EMK17684.1 ATP-dependent DNA ligase-like domain protein [Leptospira interrogans str. Kito]MCH5434503.1 WGR domain-containing protein [Leptospira interrogans serovar Canicola]OLZ29547.1 ATP-dependent DNA ligase [Leptospira interrogans serovar Canicola]POR16755.1 ATP-dependent DNA ligase [Leptospira interrogans serovar Canico
MNHQLTFKDDKSDKFWNIETSGNSFTVTYGKTGTAGTSQTKTFETEETCIKEARKLLSEKLKKGYIEGNDRTEKLTSNNDKKHKSNQQEADKIVISKSEEKTKSAPQKVIEESENEIKQSSQTSANKKENLKQNSQTQEQNSNPLPSENSTELNKISLYYQGDGSDKVYHVNIDPEGDGYVVHFAFGRRGSSLQTGTKTSKPVSYEAAQKIMRQLVNSKMAKGYTEIESGAPYLHSTKEERVSGVHCQLLNPIDEEELSTYVEDDQYGAQEKLDGNRMMIRKIGDNVEGINRKGLIIAISQILHDHSLSFSEDFILDGEVIGDVFFPFDIFSKDGKDIQHLPYQERYAILESILKDQDEIFHIVKLVKSTKGKKVLLEELREKQKEGIVFKDLNAPYKAGRPSSKGSQIKFKFYETATISVETVNLKRSVSMRLYNGNEWVSVGNVTIPVNSAIPKENDIIEVRYLYAYKGGSLYQPTYLGVRTDADENDCDLKQLKYKNA